MKQKKQKRDLKANKATIHKILQYAAQYKGKLALAMVFAVLYVVCTLTTPVLIGHAIDEIVGKGQVNFPAIDRKSVV